MTRESRGMHKDFPSMETALITISLLLFAVYLIKLVMVSFLFSFSNGILIFEKIISENFTKPSSEKSSKHQHEHSARP